MKPWTPEFVAFLRDVRSESVIAPDCSKVASASRAEWRLIQTAQRLEWLYGSERAAAIMNRADPETEADIAAWDGRVPNKALSDAA